MILGMLEIGVATSDESQVAAQVLARCRTLNRVGSWLWSNAHDHARSPYPLCHISVVDVASYGKSIRLWILWLVETPAWFLSFVRYLVGKHCSNSPPEE